MSSERHRTAAFLDVTPPGRRCPSWVAKQRVSITESSVPVPASLPQEFVQALHREIAAASERPPPEELRHAPAVVEPTPSELVPPPRPSVDPRLTEAMVDAIEQLTTVRAELLAQTASQLAELAAIIAQRVIARELSIDPRIIHDLVSEGVEALGQHDRLLVRLGSGFVDLLDEVEERLSSEPGAVDVRLDSSLSPYGCVVETELGRVDESVEERLATLLQALKPESSPPG